HQFGAVDELDELVRDLGEPGLVGQELQGQPGDFLRAGLELALGIDVTVEGAPRRAALDELDATDLDDAVVLAPFQAGGFGVEDDVAHGVGRWGLVGAERGKGGKGNGGGAGARRWRRAGAWPARAPARPRVR